jgi:predicted deacylase
MSQPIEINGTKIWPGEQAEISLSRYQLPSHTVIEVPVFVFRSEHPGPRVLFQAGMHGDETNGVEIIRNLICNPGVRKPLCGTVILIPLLNIVSFLNSSRDLPDGRDLNRCFPGSKSGSLGSRIAWDLSKGLLPQIDFGVDFHTGGAKINNYPQLRCTFEDEKSLELAKMFGAPFVLNSPFRDKSFRKEAARQGKSILVFEGGESMRFNKLAITEGIQGSLRMLNALGMTKEEVPAGQTIMLKDTTWTRARASGLFRTGKKYGGFVEKNSVIGTISDPLGKKEHLLITPEDGFIIGINNQPVVNEGDALIHIGVE